MIFILERCFSFSSETRASADFLSSGFRKNYLLIFNFNAALPSGNRSELEGDGGGSNDEMIVQ